MIRAYERLAEIPLDEGLKAIAKGKLQYRGVCCHTSSTRLLTYCHYGVDCVVPGCKISGEYFAIERAINQQTSQYHLNLYGLDASGREVMITSDHRLPKSKGGSNELHNRQPMCYPHNAQKGNKLIYL